MQRSPSPLDALCFLEYVCMVEKRVAPQSANRSINESIIQHHVAFSGTQNYGQTTYQVKETQIVARSAQKKVADASS